jgi:hypothetical protein
MWLVLSDESPPKMLPPRWSCVPSQGFEPILWVGLTQHQYGW